MAPSQSKPMKETSYGMTATKWMLNSEVDDQVENAMTKESTGSKMKINSAGAKEIVKVVKNPEPIFKTFSAYTQLQEGLCVLRHLGGSRYEIANLEKLSHIKLGSKGAGNELKSSPERVALLMLTDRKWAKIASKVKLVARVAAKDIFPFQKLPAELRFKIYELIIYKSYPISFREQSSGGLISHTLQLMLTCRQFYEECQAFFWRNNFEATPKMLSHLRKSSYFAQNVRAITYCWNDLVLDGGAFSKIAKFPRLEILNIEFRPPLLDAKELESDHSRNRNRNCLHQNEPSIKRFSIANGFDSLVQIRGLESVIFKRRWTRRGGNDIAEIAAFNKFLNETLTLPNEGGVMNRDYKPPVPKKRTR